MSRCTQPADARACPLREDCARAQVLEEHLDPRRGARAMAWILLGDLIGFLILALAILRIAGI